MIRLKKGTDWGNELVLRLPCGHEVVILRKWVAPDGHFDGRCQCGTCRKIFDEIVLEEWSE